MTNDQKALLDRILTNVGDLGFRRRIVTLLSYLDVQPGDAVLDCGCGEGFYTLIFSELFDCRVHALDYSRELVGRAKGWVSRKDRVRFHLGDVVALPFPDETFDRIVCTEVLEHIPDDARAVSELYRVLKKGGTLAVTVPNHNYPFLWDPLNKVREGLGLGHFSPENAWFGGLWHMHIRLYHPHEVRALLERGGFTVEQVQGLTHYCLPFTQIALQLGKKLYTRLPVPKYVYSSMEKFEWRQASDRRRRVNPFQWGLSVFKAVDRLNDGFESVEKSSMCVALKLRK